MFTKNASKCGYKNNNNNQELKELIVSYAKHKYFTKSIKNSNANVIVKEYITFLLAT